MGKIEGLKSIKSSQGKAYETYALQMWGERVEERGWEGQRRRGFFAKSQYRTVMKAGEVGERFIAYLSTLAA
jgi:hypothetical protein